MEPLSQSECDSYIILDMFGYIHDVGNEIVLLHVYGEHLTSLVYADHTVSVGVLGGNKDQ